MISLLNLRQIVVAALCMATVGVHGHAAELLTGIAAAKPENAGEVRTVTVAGDWQVQCNESAGSTNCRMSTVGSATNAAGGAVTVQLASEARDGGGQLFFFLTPLDLLVARGVEMRIDGGGAQKLAYRSCHVQGCVIPFRLSGGLENRFRRGSKLALRLFDIDGKPLDIEMSLIGFIAARRAMEGG